MQTLSFTRCFLRLVLSSTHASRVWKWPYLFEKHSNIATKIKECLLKRFVRKDNKDECLEEISKAQAKIEKLAFEIYYMDFGLS